MKSKLFVIALLSTLWGCASSTNPYNPQEFATQNYQKNVVNAVDAADVLKDFDQNKIPKANLESADLSNLVQADLYFNQGNYAKAYGFYDYLGRKYKDPRLIYKAIICGEHVSVTLQQVTQLNELVNLFIQIDPNSQLAKLFQIKVALNSADTTLAKNDLDFLINHNESNARVILLFLSSMVSNDVMPSAKNSLVEFSQYVTDEYAQYPEANLLAVVGYSVANDAPLLMERLDYINTTYPTWRIPFYWSAGILSHYNNNDTLIQVLKPSIATLGANDPILQNIYVGALLATKQLNEAQTYLQSQLTAANKANILINLGIINAKSGNYSQALTYFTQAKISDPSLNSVVALVIASIYDYQNDNFKAVAYYKQVVATNQYLAPIASIMLLNDYVKLNDYNLVNQLLMQMATKAGLNEKQAILFKSSYLVSINQYSKAFDLLQAKFAIYANDPDYLYQYASMAALLYKTKLAINLYKKYIKLAPQNVYGYNDLAYIYADQTHEYTLAKKYANKALALAPLDPNVLDTVGWVNYKLGNYALAYTYIKNSYDANHDKDTALHLKAVYLALNKPALAKQVVVVKNQGQLELKQQLMNKSLSLLIYLQYGMGSK